MRTLPPCTLIRPTGHLIQQVGIVLVVIPVGHYFGCCCRTVIKSGENSPVIAIRAVLSRYPLGDGYIPFMSAVPYPPHFLVASVTVVRCFLVTVERRVPLSGSVWMGDGDGSPFQLW